MNRILKTVKMEIEVEILFDDSLIPDDEWRESIYSDIKTADDVAKHFAYNAVLNGVDRLSQLDGWADRNDDLLQVKVDRDVFMDVD